MSNEDNTDSANNASVAPASTPAKRATRSRLIGGSALAGMLLLGAVAGAAAMKFSHHEERQALLPPVAISAMADDSLVAVKGNVAEIFGNKFIITDSSGRALVDVGPKGEDASLVSKNEEVTVQGRFDKGFVHAGIVIHGDGRVDELRPPHPGPHHGWRGPGSGEPHGLPPKPGS